jgi:obg-like ATPase 1
MFILGLGNAFLSHIKACDGIFHMVRIFDDPDIVHIEGNVDPIRDIEIIHDELRLKDLELAKKIGEDLEKKFVRGNEKTLKIDHVSFFQIVFPSFIYIFNRIPSIKFYIY